MANPFHRKFSIWFPAAVVFVLILAGIWVYVASSEDQIDTLDEVKQDQEESLDIRESVSKPSAESNSKPILKNLGVNIDTWNRATNLAGDLIFDRRVIYDDGRVAGDKVFLDFGMRDKYRVDGVGAIEYWFYVPLGTKVRAPIDGTVQIDFFEHTKDWGVNIVSKGSPWIVSFEHLVNLKVKEGDIVKAGDIVGEAAPRISNAIAMVELVVWTGGQKIIKYCPFSFLDEPLKPIYEEKIRQLAKDWESFSGLDVYREENWILPGCLVDKIVEN